MLEIEDIDFQISSYYDIDTINHFLEQGHNMPIIFDDCILSVTIKNVNREEFLYRRLFEDSFLHRKVWKSNVIDLYISLSEAMLFINTATPPILKDKIRESTSNINDVIECLKTFLIEDSKSRPTHISIFKDCVMLKRFENPWKQMITNNPMLLKKCETMIDMSNSNNLNHAIYIMYSQFPISRLLEYHKDKKELLLDGTYVFLCKQHDDDLNLKLLYDISSNKNSNIIAVGNIGAWTGYIFCTKNFTNSISSLIYDSYSGFLK